MTDHIAPHVVRYGDHPAQLAELTRPEGASRGVVVVIHGGFWRDRYDLSLGRPLAADLAARGWTAYNLEYRRVGGGGGGSRTLDDVAAGIDALAGIDLGLDVVVTLGHSAGGHLATWAAGRSDPGVRVTHVIAQAAVLDLAEARRLRLGAGAVDAFLDDEPLEPADPTSRIPLEVPVWAVHPTRDANVPVSQSRDYVAAARAAGARAELLETRGDHFAVIDTGHAAWAAQVTVLDAISPTGSGAA